MAAAQFDPIVFSDYDSLRNVVRGVLGPLQETAPGVYLYGTGYGLSESSLFASLYPFTKTISSISNSNPARVTCTTPHRLVAGEVIYIDNISAPAWSATPLNGAYFTVGSVITNPTPGAESVTFTLQGVNTNIGSTYTAAWTGSGTVEQYVVSANQFANLRVDTAKAYKHVFGFNPSATTLPTMTNTNPAQPTEAGRGKIIQHNVFQPFYTTITDINAKKLVLGESLDYQWPTAVERNGGTSPWTSSITVAFTVEWPTAYDFVQFFNTGGLMKFDIQVDQLTNAPSNSLSKNTKWQELAQANFPRYYGAYDKNTQGYTDSSLWCSSGAFQATTSGFTTILGPAALTGTYSANTILIQHRVLTDKKLSFEITLTDGHANVYSENVTARFRFFLNFIYSVGGVPLNVSPISSGPSYVVAYSKAFS